MKLTDWEKREDALYLETESGIAKLTPVSNRIIRVVFTQDREFSSKESLVVLPQAEESVRWEVREDTERLVLRTPVLQIEIRKETCAITYLDGNGRLLTKEPERGGKTHVPIEVEKTVYDGNVTIKTGQGADGVRARVEGSRKTVDRRAYHTKLEFEWQQDEALYGLGSHEEGVMNLRGSHQYLYQQNMKAVVPMIVSTRGYAVLWDSCSCMIFRDDMHGSYLWTDADDEMDFYFIYGPEFDELVGGYRKLTGAAPMLPKWAFGYAQSKERYKSQEELLDILREYRERKLPLDLLILDWQSWPGDWWGQKSLDPERFPDPAGMMRSIHEEGARLMVSIWPIMNNNGPNQQEMRNRGFLLGNQANYDPFQPEARRLYWDQANDGLFKYGIDAWWCDCTEPFEADWKGAVKPEPEQRLSINVNEFKSYLDPEFINAYSLLHSRGIYEGQRETGDEKRVVNLTRSAYAGQQRYGAITWSGDTAASWTTLRNQIPAGLHFCATGVPYWTMDIGAFFVGRKPEMWFWNGDYDRGCEDDGYRELYVRWFQLGAFLPMFRSHGTDTPREVWRFGEPGTVFYDTLAKFLRLRYRLMPYIYSLAGSVTHEHYTMLRMLAFDFREDIRAHDIGDQFMFGPAFMVNPVTEPMYDGSRSRKPEGVSRTRQVYLPAGTDWYDFWTGKRLEGGQEIEAEAPLEIIPLFVRAGSIVPMGPVVQNTDELGSQPYEIRIYPGRDGSFGLYEDEGDNYNYEKGDYAWIQMEWLDKERTFRIGRRNGAFPGLVRERRMNLILVGTESAQGNGEAETNVFDCTVTYSGEAVVISFDSGGATL
ncbi:glycoside hydrolase family 31 protein [Cohnella silvisoli]|uniref:Glycoside hydrolase family 31 protein n=1 Tax=Cohnella silvisoli TaxID=2873699 RepID=A0ABV1KQH9_9BACL|nr:glycoside hydrolase family 31 protein [Cohnella silvisoli]MCD9022012.1 DUF5110 domain-containing protein [Cohnella silvisoli]